MTRSAEDINLQTALEDAEIARFRSECPPDRKIRVDDLFRFRRGRGDLILSGLMLALALFLLVSFFTNTGWQARKLPADFGTYLGYQLGLWDIEGRAARFGRILKQPWVAPMLFLVVLVPAAIWNMRASLRTHRWRVRFLQPVDTRYELSQWLRALEFILWFLAYTLAVPWVGYLVATLVFGTVLPWRLGYRGRRWLAVSLGASFAIVLIFRSFLQIRTPVNIWLYEQIPAGLGTFLKVWF